LLVDFYKRKRSQIGMLKEKKKSSLESKNSVSVSSPKEKEHGFFDKTWKKLLSLGAGAGAIYAIWLLYEKIVGTIPGS